MTIKRKLATWSLLAALMPALAGCFGIAAVGMGAGALMISDRRPSDTYLTDEAIELRASKAINEKYPDRVHVNITSYNRTVLITGEVPDESIKADIEQIVAGRPNVKATQNELRISGLASLGSSSNDTLITSKVKARLMNYGKYSPNLFKVVTEGGTVYLMGLVTRNEGDDATQIVRETSGVLGVVRLFEYLSDEEARRLDIRQTEPAKAPVR
ncbi:MAG: BON domain-containing protein [Georgfuchsia sp.]